MALYHKLCHTLGGSFNLPHADVHAVVLPHTIAFNQLAAPEAMLSISRAFGESSGGTDRSAASRLFDLVKKQRCANNIAGNRNDQGGLGPHG